MRTPLLALALFAVLSTVSRPPFAAPAAPLLPLQNPTTLPVVAGATSELSVDAAKSGKGLVLVFLSARCPCSTSHEAKLRRYAAEFGPKGFTFIGIHANADESQAEAREHFAKSELGFPVVRDDGSLADTLGALKTPHVFVVSKDRQLLFSGGVDDSKDAARAKREFLRDALTEIEAGKTPQVREARTLGCIIKRKSP